PTVHSRDPYWAQKHPELAGHELAEGRADATRVAQNSPEVQVADAGAHGEAEHHIHMPDPSYWPLVAAFGLFLAGFGVLLGAGLGDWLFNPFVIADYVSGSEYYAVTGVGLFVLLVGIFGWSLEPVNG